MDSTNMNHLFENFFMISIMGMITPLMGALISALSSKIGDALTILWEFLERKMEPTQYSVTISKNQHCGNKFDHWSSYDDEQYNHHLIEAVLEFITAHAPPPDIALCNLGEGNNDSADIDLNYDMAYAKTRPINLIPVHTMKYKEFNIVYKQKSTDASKKELLNRKIMIKISSSRGTAHIQKFIGECYNEYIVRHYGNEIEQKQRFYYTQSNDGERLEFKKFLIENRTTFDDMFFPEKQKVIDLLDKLDAGEIHKLSFLLHGLPGCGKTSVIKSIANYTDRHIFNVKLSLVKNDLMLMDIFHNPVVENRIHSSFDNDTDMNYVPLNKRIYIFEDIDAECDLVHQRMEDSKSIEGKSMSDSDEEGSDSDEENNPKNKNTKMGATKIGDIKMGDMMKKYAKMFKDLTLSGILNTIDGVLELNGAILIMTTNHINKLDKALIRPGRITMNLEMKKMLGSEANAMIKKHFSGFIGKEISIPDNLISPALLESLIQQSSNISDLATMINRELRSFNLYPLTLPDDK